MTTNTIRATASDNELIIVALNTDGNSSYQLMHLQSGYNSAVNVTASIVSSGTYQAPGTFNGLRVPLNTTYPVSLPRGTYSIVAVGINWGGPAAFSVSINGAAPVTHNGGSTGVVWSPNLGNITVS